MKKDILKSFHVRITVNGFILTIESTMHSCKEFVYEDLESLRETINVLLRDKDK